MTRTALWFGEQRAGGRVTRTWTDPCPACGTEVAGLDVDAITVVDNPEAVLSLHNPACPYDDTDPDSPDCICTVIINPAPPPWLDTEHVVGWRYTLRPCGHQAGRVRIYRQTTPAAGSLGELYADWAAERGGTTTD